MKLFSNLSKTALVMLGSLACLFVFFLVAGLLAMLLYPFEPPLPYCLGLALGSFISMLKVLLLDHSISKSLDLEGKQAQNYAGVHALLRHGLTILFLLGAVFYPQFIGLFGVIIGVLLLQAAAFLANQVLKRRPDWV